eukprot:Nitzschia sp. Nitz4//scaffold24_size164493//4780//8799//NITZ4_002303-RA/size164493-processed-gene-0.218-mRNA-1//-1//CDS//3329544039//5386//frame0
MFRNQPDASMSRYEREINILRHDLRQAIEQTRMMERERDAAEENTRMWQNRVHEQQEVLDERDKAIETLVARTLQVRREDDAASTASTFEVRRLHQTVSKQERTVRAQNDLIQRQNEEVKNLRHQLQKLQSFHSSQVAAPAADTSSESSSSEVAALKAELQRTRAQLGVKRHLYSQASKQANNTDSKVRMLEEENEAQQAQLRDLKRQLWDAKGSLSTTMGELQRLQSSLRNNNDNPDVSMASEGSHPLHENQAARIKLLSEQLNAKSKQLESSEAKVGQLEIKFKDAKEECNRLRNDMGKQTQITRKALEREVEAREASEKKIKSLYEQQIAQVNKEREEELFRLQEQVKDLVEMQGKSVGFQNGALETLRAEMQAAQQDLVAKHETEVASLTKEKEAALQTLKEQLATVEETHKSDKEQLERSFLAEKEADRSMSDTTHKAEVETLESQLAHLKSEKDTMEAAIRSEFAEKMETLQTEKSDLENKWKQDMESLQSKHSDELASLQAQLVESQEQASKSNDTSLTKLREEIESARSVFAVEKEDLEAQLQSSREALATVEAQLVDLKENHANEVNDLQNQLRDMQADKENTAAQESALEALQNDLTALKEDHKREVEDLTNALELAQKRNEEFESSLRSEMDKERVDLLASKDEQIASLQRELDTVKQLAEEVQNDIRAREAAQSEAQSTHEKLMSDTTAEVATLKDELSKVQSEKLALEQQGLQVSALEEQLSELRVSLEDQRNKYEESLASSEAEKQALSQEKDELLSKLKGLEELIESAKLDKENEIQNLKAEQAAELEKFSSMSVGSVNSVREEMIKMQSEHRQELEALQAQLSQLSVEHETNMAALTEKHENEKSQLTTEKDDFVSSLRDELSALESKHLSEVQSLSQGHADQLSASEAKISSLESQISELEERNAGELANLNLQYTEAQRALEQFQSSSATAEQKLNEMTAERDSVASSLQSQLTELESKYNEETSALRSKLEQTEQQLSELAKEKESSMALQEELNQKLAAADSGKEAEVAALTSELEGLRESSLGDVKKLNETISSMETRLLEQQRDHELEVERLRTSIAELQGQGEEKKVDSADGIATQEQVMEVKKRLENLKELNSELEEENHKLAELLGEAEVALTENVNREQAFEQTVSQQQAEVERLQHLIDTMRDETSPVGIPQTVSDLEEEDRMLEIHQRLAYVEERNTKLQEQNLQLSGRLERKTIEVKSLEFEKQHAEELEKENLSLMRQVKEMATILEGMQAKSSRKSKSSSSSGTSSSPTRPSPSSGAADNGSGASQPTPSVDKENPVRTKENKSGKAKKGLKGIFKRKAFSSEDVIQE